MVGAAFRPVEVPNNSVYPSGTAFFTTSRNSRRLMSAPGSGDSIVAVQLCIPEEKCLLWVKNRSKAPSPRRLVCLRQRTGSICKVFQSIVGSRYLLLSKHAGSKKHSVMRD